MRLHEKYMHRAVQIAYRGRGHTRTNPMVGALIVHNEKIIGEGYHTAFGKPHAEIEALNAVSAQNRKLLPESQMYVSLEPCAHYGKTPPCSRAIIQSQIQKVYVGMQDPFAKVKGKGIQMLRSAGIEVQTGISEQECKQLLHRFSTHIREKRPYIHLKWAQSKDGIITKSGEQTKISDPATQMWTHKLRSQNDAILVGTNTLLIDNPSLDNRLFPGPSPIKLILDRKGKIRSGDYRFFRSEGTTLGLISGSNSHKHLYDDIIEIPDTLAEQAALKYILKECYSRDIASIFVEGGSKLIHSFLDLELWDQADIIRSKKLVLEEGIKAPVISGKRSFARRSASDEILRLYPNEKTLKNT